jgi:hypothetical protein
MSEESLPNSESIERAALIEALRTKGLEDSETLRMLNLWFDEIDSKDMVIGTRVSQIETSISKADLFIEAGLKEVAQEWLESTIRILDCEADAKPPAEITPSEVLAEYRKQIEDKLDSLL